MYKPGFNLSVGNCCIPRKGAQLPANVGWRVAEYIAAASSWQSYAQYSM